MVWIHGGGYVVGSGNDKRPDYLVAKDIILVSINYRLGALGEIYSYESTVSVKYFKKFYMFYSLF
jgi:carboxylesterase type B